MTTGDALLLLRSHPSDRPFPPVPTREQVCRIQMSFQGLTVTLAGGPIAWFEAALCCLSAADRQVVYAAKQGAGDTHALILFTAGVALYPEANQPYQAYQCPNYETHPADFVALVEEVRRAGFIPAVFFDERESESSRLMPLAIAALKTSTVRDLNQDVIFVPGFDGVFYGWAPAQITAWGTTARSAGALYLAMEHNTAHIPLGNGPADYAPGGAMAWCDTILSEFDPWGAGGSPGDGIRGRPLSPASRVRRVHLGPR